MRLKAIFLAAASLLALAGATANLDSSTTRDMDLTGDAKLTFDVSNVEINSIVTERADLCNAHCHAPWLKCVDTCGGTQFCKNRCNCQLFNNPKTLCRIRKCVEPPKGCSFAKPDIVTERADFCSANCHAPWLKCVDACGGTQFCKDKCNCQLFSKERTLCRTRRCVQPPQGCSSAKADIVNERQVYNPCILCQAGINACIRECGGGEGCELSCKCNLKNSNPQCAECNDQCSTSTNDLVSRSDEHIENDSSPNSADLPGLTPKIGPWPSFGPWPTPCYICMNAVNECKAECVNPGACDDACRCYHKKENKYCRGCVLDQPCKCGHACPRLTSIQRRTNVDLIGDLATRSDKDTELFPPPPSCIACVIAINYCKGHCKGDSACIDACHCTHGTNNYNCLQCAIPCKSPAPIQRSTGIDSIGGDFQDTVDGSSSNSVTKDDEHVEHESSLDSAGVGPPLNPCVQCQYSVNYCKNKCTASGACDDTCNCYHRLNNRNCLGCKLPCNCGHACPIMPPTTRRRVGGDLIGKDSQDSVDKASIEFESAGVPNPCVVCTTGIKSCKNKCNGNHDCEVDCDCDFKKRLQCKDCKDINCPRVFARTPEDTADEPSIESDLAGVPNPCVVCATGIKSCKNKCNGNNDCKVSCDCDFKKRLQCKDCKDISCPRLMTRQILPPISDCMWLIDNCKHECPTPGACDDSCNCYYKGDSRCKGYNIDCKCGRSCPALTLPSDVPKLA